MQDKNEDKLKVKETSTYLHGDEYIMLVMYLLITHLYILS